MNHKYQDNIKLCMYISVKSNASEGKAYSSAPVMDSLTGLMVELDDINQSKRRLKVLKKW